jgi:hypothetical protein
MTFTDMNARLSATAGEVLADFIIDGAPSDVRPFTAREIMLLVNRAVTAGARVGMSIAREDMDVRRMA